MASGSQTDGYLSVYDLPHLLNEMSEIPPGSIVSFGLQLGIRFGRIQDFQRRHNNAASDILTEILHEALNRYPPLTKKEIVEALRAPSVQQSRLANQIEANYIPQSQKGPQHMEVESIPVAQTVHLQQISLQPAHQLPLSAPLHQTLENIPQTLTPSWPNTSQLFTSQQLTTQLPRLHQPQPNLDQLGQTHQLPASQRMSMTPQPGPQMQHWSQLQFPPHHPNYQHLPLQSHPGYHFPLLPNPTIHRPHESQSFPPSAPSHNQYSSLRPFHSHYSSVTQPPHDQYSQPFGNQSFTQLSHDQNIFPSPRQQPFPLPRQQPSLLPRQQMSNSPSQQQISISNPAGAYTDPPPAKRLRQLCASSPATQSTESTAVYPPLVNDFIGFVKTTYSAQKVLRDEKWSLSPTVKFINLACIDKKCVKSREYNDVTRAMVMDGNVDAIEETKGPIKFSEIAKDISLPFSGSEQEDDRRLILVEGAPGVGKSTFAWEFCRKWMNGETAQQYHLVLLLRLRDKRIREAKNLKDLFFNPSRPDESLAVYNELKNSQKLHALIILEGYDELPDSCRNDPLSVFNELISGKLLPLATVLVTSRPWATKDLHENHACHIYQHIEVLGFTKKQIKEYINKNIGEKRIISGLNSYLEKHPQIRSGMYIPLNSAIVVAVYKESIENDRQTLPNTITELYSCCIEILIRRHLKRNTGLQRGNIMNLPAINLRVPSDVHRNFVHMCYMAFSGIVEATDSEVKLIFSESELPEHFDNLGFMDSVTDLYVTGETVSSHNFLHLTFQEFFAAVHISTMSKEQQLQYFMEGNSDFGGKKGRLNVVLKFLAGLRKLDCFTNETASHIVNTPSHVSSYLTPSDITVELGVINWLFEAQSETVMSLILGERKVEFKASKSHMSPMDYYSLGYCISHSQCQWVLSLTDKIEISKEKIKMLADGARDVTGEAKVVELGDYALSHLKRDKLDLLFTECNNILCLQKLSIEDEPTVWPDFSSELGVLELCDITDKSIDFLITLIKDSSSLRKFSMSMSVHASESTHKLLELVQTIDHHPTLQEKSVKELACRLTTDGDFNALSQLCSMDFVSMRIDFIRSVGGLSDDGVVVLAEILQHKYGSRELNLYLSGTSDDGTVSLAKALHHNSTIHELKLWSNRISDKGAVALADALHHNSTLQLLNLFNNKIGDKGAVALADALHRNSTLQSLDLSTNLIGDEGAVALVEALLENQSLQKLYLALNVYIGDRATSKLVEALTQNSSINKVTLPYRCKEYATKCPNYREVQTKLSFRSGWGSNDF